jgi:hypothetical protein
LSEHDILCWFNFLFASASNGRTPVRNGTAADDADELFFWRTSRTSCGALLCAAVRPPSDPAPPNET